MTNESLNTVDESLGQFLRNTRKNQGYDFDRICTETKISRSNLRAMESDDYAALPADAFAKGFYNIYAKVLGLAPDEIIARFIAERGSASPGKNQDIHNPPARKAQKQLGNMAEPSGVSPLSTIGLALLLLIVIGAGICWHFNINPATFISEKLRGMQSTETTEAFPESEEGNNDGDRNNDVTQQKNDNSTGYFQVGGEYFSINSNSRLC